MTKERRRAQRAAGLGHKDNLLSVSGTLRLREAWKYVLLEKVLAGRKFKFEYELDGHVFDLALLDRKVLVEFDGPDHRESGQKGVDAKKDYVAKAHGFVVVRRIVAPSSVLSPTTIKGL